jgi:L-amino acid N-acyltransferase YncA
MSERFVRLGRREDAARIASIYNQGIADGDATFQTARQDAGVVLSWFDQDFPVCVAGRGELIMAYAVASLYRPTKWYEGVREFSVYAAREGRGKGHASDALFMLFDACRARGYWKLVSRIFPENSASLGLCDRLGFRRVGHYQRHAQLHGTWRDVVIVEKLL